MKLLLNLGLIALIGIGILLCGKVLGGSVSAASSGPQKTDFPNFPEGKGVGVSFDFQVADSQTITDRERADQFRDWILMTVVQSAGLSPSETAEVLYDIAPIRVGYYKPVSNLEFGETRTCVFPNGLAVGILPKTGAESQEYYRAYIADQYRKNTGEIPDSITLFEYDMNGESAVVTRQPTMKGEDLFTESSGYHEATVGSLIEFKAWFSRIDDLTFAKQEGNRITLGGRKFKDRAYRNIRVEDVAAIYQANRKLFVAFKAFEDKWKQRENALNASWENRTYITETERMSLERERDAEYAQFERDYAADAKATKLTPECGFSLDPTFDYKVLLKLYDEELLPFIKPFIKPSKDDPYNLSIPSEDELRKRLGLDSPNGGSESNTTIVDTEPLSQKDLDIARKSLEANDADDLYRVMGKVSRENAQVAELLEGLMSDCRFQHARYDGDLGGTEVGMVLFYTDLLAKLWALDFVSNTPRTISDFQSLISVKLSPIYEKQERELSSTRLWFGPQDKGFQFAGEGGTEIAFARVATRVYAAGSNPFNPGAESDPNPSSEQFLGWWNDHYEEVARYEPEYERLNEIMKWSVLTGWLDKAEKGELLDFLSTENVTKDRWFPDWVRSQPNLKFKAWDQIKFFERSNELSKTEALPILESEGFTTFSESDPQHVLTGGVSLGGRSLFAKRAPVTRAASVPGLARRSIVDYASSSGLIKTYDGTTFQFAKNAGSTQVNIISRQNARLRGAIAEVGDGNAMMSFGRKFASRPDGLSVRSEIQSVAHGEVQIASRGNGFRAGWRGRDLDRAFTVGKKMSVGESAESAARSTPGVDSIKVVSQDTVAIKFENSNVWLEISRTPSGNPKLGGQWSYRVGELSGSAKEVRIAVAAETQVGGGIQKIGRSTSNAAEPLTVVQRAKQIADDPVGYVSRIRAERSKALREIDEAIAKHEFESARSMLDELQSLYGSSHEIGIRQAITEIQAGKSAGTVADSMGIPRGTTQEATIQNFYKEVQSRIGSGSAKPGTTNVFETGRCLDWRNFLGRNGRRTDAVGMSVVDGKPKLTYDLTGQSGPRASTYGGDGPLYIDSVKLNQIDWNAPIERSFQQCLDAGLNVVKLPLGDVAHFRPGEVYFRSGSTAKVGRLVGEARTPTNGLRAIYLNPYNGEEDEEDKAIYVAYVP